MDLSVGTIMCGVVFGGVGFSAFLYGRKQRSAKPMVLGALLMVYSYVIPNLWAQIAVGVVLTALLFVEF